MPPIAVVLWIREFQYRAAEERFWEVRTMPQFALELRTAVAKASRNLPLLEAILAWIKMPTVTTPKSSNSGPRK